MGIFNDKPNAYEWVHRTNNEWYTISFDIIENTIQNERSNIYGNENGQNQVGNDRRETSYWDEVDRLLSKINKRTESG